MSRYRVSCVSYEFIEWPHTRPTVDGNQIYGERVQWLWTPSINEMRPNFLSILFRSIFIIPPPLHSCHCVGCFVGLTIFANENPKMSLHSRAAQMRAPRTENTFCRHKNTGHDSGKIKLPAPCVCACSCKCWQFLSQRRVTHSSRPVAGNS